MVAIPLEDIHFWPNLSAYPECFIRLKNELVSKEETEPKEVMVFDHDKAQALLTSSLKKAGYTNSRVSALSKKHPTFLAPSSRAFPFTSKALLYLLKAVDAGKPCPMLEECRPSSLALPTGEKDWNEIHLTFSVAKLNTDIAGQQFHENRRREQETKERPGMHKDVTQISCACHFCQMVGKHNEYIKKASLHSIEARREPFSKVMTIIVAPLPRIKKGHKYMLTLMCPVTRYPEDIPVRNISAKVITEKLLDFFTKFEHSGYCSE
ncbi:uncharacterized protein [Palaemon carinicauda]|uniref:uncharacterized protein n=1 Tax=Palaemon carinicauda TaxID=392227 RepID=UPI0035B60B99